MRNSCLIAVMLTIIACGGGDDPPTGNDEPVSTVTINGAGSNSLELDATRSLSTTLRDAQNRVLTGRQVAWSAAPAGRVTLSAATGTSTTITGVGLGAVTVTATSEGKNGSVSFTVVEEGETPNEATVTLGGSSFNPSSVTIRNGGTVTWNNNSGVQHNLLWDTRPAGAADRNPFTTGTSYSHVFTANGTFAYHCSIHPGMDGEVVVVP